MQHQLLSHEEAEDAHEESWMEPTPMLPLPGQHQDGGSG